MAMPASGGDLAVIGSLNENVWLRTQAGGTNEYLVGLQKLSGLWQWVDGSPAPLHGQPGSNWWCTEPQASSKDCGSIDSGLWKSWSCTNGEDWICEIPPAWAGVSIT